MDMITNQISKQSLIELLRPFSWDFNSVPSSSVLDIYTLNSVASLSSFDSALPSLGCYESIPSVFMEQLYQPNPVPMRYWYYLFNIIQWIFKKKNRYYTMNKRKIKWCFCTNLVVQNTSDTFVFCSNLTKIVAFTKTLQNINFK